MNKRHDFWNLRAEVIRVAEEKMMNNPRTAPSNVARKILHEISEMYGGDDLLLMVTEHLGSLARETAEEIQMIIELDTRPEGAPRRKNE